MRPSSCFAALLVVMMVCAGEAAQETTAAKKTAQPTASQCTALKSTQKAAQEACPVETTVRNILDVTMDPAFSFSTSQADKEPKGDECPPGAARGACKDHRKCKNCHPDGAPYGHWYKKNVRGRCKTQISINGQRFQYTCTSCWPHTQDKAKRPLAFVMMKLKSRSGKCEPFEEKATEQQCLDLDPESPQYDKGEASPTANATMCTKIVTHVKPIAISALRDDEPEHKFFKDYKNGMFLKDSHPFHPRAMCALKKETICRKQGNISKCAVRKHIRCLKLCRTFPIKKAPWTQLRNCEVGPCEDKHIAGLLCKTAAMMG